MLPPYAKAVQAETGLPVFDFLTMIDYVYAGTHRKAYQGYSLTPLPRSLADGHAIQRNRGCPAGDQVRSDAGRAVDIVQPMWP